MRARMVEERVGEYLGPIDWSFDFSSMDWSSSRGGVNPEVSKRAMEWLRELEANPESYEATIDGGWPKIGWKRVLQVGMYDGWPFWKPVPSVLLSGALGSEWHPWYSISAISKCRVARTDSKGEAKEGE